MPVEEVESFEVLETGKNFANLFLQINPGASPPIPNFGGIISIYTKRGIGLFGALNKTKGLDLKTIPVFNLEKEFYTPLYDGSDPNSFLVPDLRSTVYWNPNILKSLNGKNLIDYYHSDDEGEFIVIIESISLDGKIGYKELSYSVFE